MARAPDSSEGTRRAAGEELLRRWTRSRRLRLLGVRLTELEEDYVDTFDNRRRHNLFLTYFAHGDTRKRGMAGRGHLKSG